MSDLWSEASRDLDAENRLRSMTAAKQESYGVWQFLALASSKEEYDHRQELALDSLFAIALKNGLQLTDLTASYDEQFRLLREAKDFTVEIKDDDPEDKGKFGDKNDAPKSDDSDDDDEDEDGDNKGNPFGKSDDDGGKGGKPVTTKPHQKPSDGAVAGDDDGGNDGSDDDSDDDDSDDKGSDDSGDSAPPWAKKSSRFASLLARIERGEDPRNWRRTAAEGGSAGGEAGENENDDGGGAEGGGAASSAPSAAPAAGAATSGAGASSSPSAPSTSTAPAGATTTTAPPQGQVTTTNNPTNTNGGSMTASLTAALIAEIGSSNPNLPFGEIVRLAGLAMKVADGGDPLQYGDRGSVADGPATSAAKSWSPPNLDGSPPSQDGSGGGDGSGSGGSGGSGGGGGKSGGGASSLVGPAISTAIKLLPDLLAV